MRDRSQGRLRAVYHRAAYGNLPSVRQRDAVRDHRAERPSFFASLHGGVPLHSRPAASPLTPDHERRNAVATKRLQLTGR